MSPFSWKSPRSRAWRFISVAADAKRLSDNTSPAEPLVLLRQADRVEDLGRLAPVSDAAGSDTRKVKRVPGTDAFRLLHRVSHLAELAIDLAVLVATQLAAIALGRAHLRALVGGRPRRPLA